ncbi:Crp/Fnr family transcriptional regulator [Taibaiella sp. KBW10]|nr:Crp/Fnr family transcriptional regulator [Taibaiella sp. KBW10]
MNDCNDDNCVRCAHKNSSVFCNTSNESLDFINKEKVCTTYKKGQVIFHEGTRAYGLYCISSGKIKISKNGDDGKEHIYRLAKPGDLIGYKALLSDAVYSASAIVLEETTVCFIPKERFLKVLSQDANLSLDFMKLMGQELGRAEQKVAHLAQKPVRERLAEALLFIKETYGFDEDGITLNVRLTRDELANIVGTATESAIRLLSEFKKDGIIELNGKSIRLLDYNKLLKTANLQD